jgi:hypothetical protein
MPSIRASARVSLNGWEPVRSTPPGEAAQGSPPAPAEAPARSPFMTAPMPLMASTADAFTRQFYGPGKVPQQRIFPARKGGPA